MSRISSTFGRTSPSPRKSEIHSALTRSHSFGHSQNKKPSNSTRNSISFMKQGTVVESEYIKNLQQQIYFLELEASYLRDQLKKSNDLHPVMTNEAERMLSKLKDIKLENDKLSSELSRRDSALSLAQDEKNKLLNRIELLEDRHSREKQMLTDQLVSDRKNREMLTLEGLKKDDDIDIVNEELRRSKDTISNCEQQISMLKTQLSQRSDQQKLSHLELHQKRNDLIQKEGLLRELEQKYDRTEKTAESNEKLVQNLRAEIQSLRERLRELELSTEQNRMLRNKLSDDAAGLIKENTLLQKQVLESESRLNNEIDLRETKSSREIQNLKEIALLEDKEQQALFELKETTRLLDLERNRNHDLLQQLSLAQQKLSSTEFSLLSSQSELTEMDRLRNENQQLEKDKGILVDHIDDLQTQIKNINRDLLAAEDQLATIKRQAEISSSLNAEQWNEVNKLAAAPGLGSDLRKSLSFSRSSAGVRGTPTSLVNGYSSKSPTTSLNLPTKSRSREATLSRILGE